jgi:CBS-domain-containing membrane protein
MVLTSALIIGHRSVHPPACATTLIVCLGLLSTPVEGAIIVGAVATLYGHATGWAWFGPAPRKADQNRSATDRRKT